VSAGNDDRILSGSERKVIEGSIEPEKISDYFKYGPLIRAYGRRAQGDLRNKLSVDDQEILRKMAVQEPIEHEAVTEWYRQARIRLCANRGNMTPVEIAKQSSQIALEWRLRNEARYRRGIESLSAAGRQKMADSRLMRSSCTRNLRRP
jgi:hypothetical protein